MSQKISLVILLFFGTTGFLYSVCGAHGQSRPESTFLKSILFVHQTGSIPMWRRVEYSNGSKIEARYNGKGYCSIEGFLYLRPNCHFEFGTGCQLQTGDVVGMLGGVFRATCDRNEAKLIRIPDDEIPKGTRLPDWDSITIPLSGISGFGQVALKVQEIISKQANETSAELDIDLISWIERPKRTTKIELSANVKSGEFILLRDKGHLVRAIVPPNRETRVVGWLELSLIPIPETDLIRDKKTYVRPVTRNRKPE